MPTKSLKIMFRFDWNDEDETVTRLWDGSGPYVDSDGNLWRGAVLTQGATQAIEQAINGDAAAIDIGLSGVDTEADARAWAFYQAGGMTDAILEISLQPCDERDQPDGSRLIVFTGRVDNVVFDNVISGGRPVATIAVRVVNKFSLRRLLNGASLSDTDQKARAAVLNPGADPDRFAERVPLMQDKTITWPRFS